jgi:hypothetical protein
MNLLALDLAGNSGWARWCEGNTNVSFGHVGLPKADQGMMIAAFADWLKGQIVMNEISHIVHEAVFVDTKKVNAQTLEKLYGLRARLLELCYRHGLTRNEVPVSQWRGHFIQHRTAPKYLKAANRRKWLKDEVRKECRARGWAARTDDESDALGLLDYERCRLFPEFAVNTSPLFAGAAHA